MHFTTLFATLGLPVLALAQVSGSAYGFARGTTGGGSAKAAAPKDLNELKSWLSDSVARVILIDKTFNFKGTEGSATEAGCYQKTCTPAQGGQTYIGSISCGGSNMQATTVTYDKAGTTGLVIGSNKSIVGVGNKGVIQGKGLRLPTTSKNVIIQNIHITDLNPASVWGGDGLNFEGNDGVWVDHVTISKVGRQMIVSHFNRSRLTISNSEFNGVTSTSASCNKNHYWTTMFIANGDQVTLDKNYWHDLSGRAPKLGADGVTTLVHATNNYFVNNKGHDFDIYKGTTALLEGNVFESVTTPITTPSSAAAIYNVPDSASASACSSVLGRSCAVNLLAGSGAWPSYKNTAVINTFKSYAAFTVRSIQASQVKAAIVGHVDYGRT